jgi:ATP-dependent protease ClpP protease subunit
MAWTVKAASESEAEILLYDDISRYWGKSAKNFVQEIKALGNVAEIALRINSIGGDVNEAQAMYNYLKMHKAHKTVIIDGLAASAASLVAMAGDKVIMPSNALMMIHNPWTFTWGEAGDMRKTADVLDKTRDTIVVVYAAKTGLDYDKIKTMMDEETWMTAEEALSMGFCDETGEAIEIAACARSLTEGDIAWKTATGMALFSRELGAKMPESAKKVPLTLFEQPAGEGAEAVNPANDVTRNPKEEESILDIKNVTDLETAFPQLVSEIRGMADTADTAAYERGVQAERERLKALDGLTGPGREAILAKAKYEEPKDARDIAMELLQASANADMLANRRDDAQAVNAVLAPNAGGKSEDEIAGKVAAAINEKRGYRA